MDRVVVILGAGGSVQYFEPPLTTGLLSTAVCDAAKWTDLLNRYHGIARGANRIERQAVLELLVQLQALRPTRNFEDYVEIVDKIASYAFDRSSDKILHTVINFLQGQLKWYPMHTWTAVPFLFRQLIAERIEEKHATEQAHDYQSRIQALGLFLKHLFHNTDLSVVSFNYDDVVFDALTGVGLVLEDGLNNTYFSAEDFLNGHSILAFPHGHSRFVLDGNGLRKYPSIAEANEKRLSNLYGVLRDKTTYLISGPNCYSFNTFMTTGRDKDDSFNANPYAAYYQRLAYDLLTARAVVVIGFSLQDPHICRLLINFRKLRSDNHILVVDYDPQPVDMFESFTNTESLIHRLLDTVDIHSIPMSGSFAQHKYALQAGVDELNATGVGQIYPQISMCKLGLAGFLADYQSILARTCSL